MNKIIIAVIFLSITVIDGLFAQDNYVFGPSVMVNDDTPGSHSRSTTQRSIICQGDTVYLVWGDNRYGNPLWSNKRVFFSKSIDAGNTWSLNLIISQDIDNFSCALPHISLDALGNIYVVYNWWDTGSANRDIYFTKSADGGDSFSPPMMVNDSAEVIGQRNCAITVDSSGQNVYVAWQDSRNYDTSGYDIYFSRSTDGGVNFLPAIRVNDGVDSMDQWRPVIACDETGQYVYVAWMDNRDTLHGWDVYFARSTDYGQTFEVNYLISDTTTTGSTLQGYPSIYYKNGIIYVVWTDHCNGYCLTFSKSTDNGVSFGPEVLVPDHPQAGGTYPSITADDSGQVYIVWDDGREFLNYGPEIYFAYSSDSGQSFNENVRVNDHSGVADAHDKYPAICVNSQGKVFVAWGSDRNDEPYGYEDIYFARGSYVGIEEYCDDNHNLFVLQCFPNPFRNKTTIKIQIPSTKSQTNPNFQTTLKIYDVSGRLVRQYDYKTIGLFNHIIWRGDDEQGHRLSCGVYFVQLVVESESEKSDYKEIRKTVLLK